MAFIGLNPSTADEESNDPTVRRCMQFAQMYGYSGMVMLNAFAYRATDPKVMKAFDSPVGPLNDDAILWMSLRVARVVCCWGVHGSYLDRGRQLVKMLRRNSDVPLWHLGLTKHGHPKHPLYLSGKTPLLRWSEPERQYELRAEAAR